MNTANEHNVLFNVSTQFIVCLDQTSQLQVMK